VVRVFVGFFSTKTIQEQVERLKEQTDDFIKGKWVEPQNYHMTFQFIGVRISSGRCPWAWSTCGMP
jgi:2'-5' RNA ligase